MTDRPDSSATIRVDIVLSGGPLDGSRIIVQATDLDDVAGILPYKDGAYIEGPGRTTTGARVYDWAATGPGGYERGLG